MIPEGVPRTSMASTTDTRTRIAAKCQNCNAVFASEIWGDGTVRPIGTKRGCPCGDGDLRPM